MPTGASERQDWRMHDLAALRLQLEWGADEALLDTPVDRFAVAPAAAIVRPVARTVPRAVAPGSSLAGVADLAALHAAIDASDSPLRATASNTVGPSGNPAAGLVLIGEAPGPDDDRSGQAYSGRPGQVLDRVLGSAGLSRDELLLAFLVPWRPPGGRPPNEGEIAASLPFIHRLLALTRPRRIVLMSGLALKALTGDASGIRRARGKWVAVTVPGMAAPVPALPMLPPELWLGSAGARSGTWADLLTLRAALGA